ncbi:MAG: N-6 DNA methylase [Deltaproteobacteria bacterium]|nr:N-6 DNA methylase [Deltaproteobacteria bacterium]
MGVWYTPREIVEYMVERVDRVLREELGEPEGLASDRVYVLDPCCGTGSYLVEVLRRIEKTIKDRGEDALCGEDIKNAAMKRIIGLEILPASFVISHMEVSLFVQAAAGSSFSDDERPAIYLTNALTGWETDKIPNQIATDRSFKMEWEAATSVKRDTPILVILGNPPYNSFAGVSLKEEGGLVERYKSGLIDQWGIKKFNMDDLYVRFFGLAEQRIAEMTGRGIVCYISNFSYLGNPSFVAMRHSLFNNFDKFWFDCMNGDSRETGKVTPDGKPDPSVFSTKYNRAGIRVGTAIGLMVRTKKRRERKRVLFRHFWGATKKTELLETLKEKNLDEQYRESTPAQGNKFSFRPSDVTEEYWQWPALVELCEMSPCNGLMEKRNGALIDLDREALEARMKMYYEREVDWDTLRRSGHGLTVNAAGFEAKKARSKVISAEDYQSDRILPYVMRPFDKRWCYYSLVSPLWNRARPNLWEQSWEGNSFFLSRFKAAKDQEGSPFYFVALLSDDHLLTPDAFCFPIRIRNQGIDDKNSGAKQQELLEDVRPRANLSQKTSEYLKELGLGDCDQNKESAGLVWMHALAIGYSPYYLIENRDGIKQDWPRVVLPNSKDLLVASAALGQQVAALLDTEYPPPSINSESVRPALRAIATVTHVEGRQVTATKGELEVTAGWGYVDNQRATMPGQGKVVQREYQTEERLSMEEEAAEIGLSYDEMIRLLGQTTLDVYLNDKVFWKNIPSGVWLYRIGGYQVIKKWLSYREMRVLGRSLTIQEIREVTNIARRLAAIILLQPQLDENYRRIKESVFEWKPT